MTTEDIRNEIKSYIAMSGWTLTNIVKIMNARRSPDEQTTTQNISNKLTRGTIKYSECREIADIIGFTIMWGRKPGLARPDNIVPQMSDVTQIGNDEFIDSYGKTYKRAEIERGEALGGGLPRDIVEMYDNPKSLKDAARRFRKLEARLEAIQQKKIYSGEYPANRHGVIEIPVLSDDDRPDDISIEEWRAFRRWKNAGRPKG